MILKNLEKKMKKKLKEYNKIKKILKEKMMKN